MPGCKVGDKVRYIGKSKIIFDQNPSAYGWIGTVKGVAGTNMQGYLCLQVDPPIFQGIVRYGPFELNGSELADRSWSLSETSRMMPWMRWCAAYRCPRLTRCPREYLPVSYIKALPVLWPPGMD